MVPGFVNRKCLLRRCFACEKVTKPILDGMEILNVAFFFMKQFGLLFLYCNWACTTWWNQKPLEAKEMTGKAMARFLVTNIGNTIPRCTKRAWTSKNSWKFRRTCRSSSLYFNTVRQLMFIFELQIFVATSSIGMLFKRLQSWFCVYAQKYCLVCLNHLETSYKSLQYNMMKLSMW